MKPGNLFAGEHVRLTAIEPGDLPAMTRWYRDSDYMRRLDADIAAPKTEKQVAEFIEEQQKSATAFAFAIRPADGEDVIGYGALEGILWSQQVTWLAIGIGEAAQRGQGYGEEAMRLMLRFAFDELNLRRVQLTVFSYNELAIRLYEKLGFRREGVFREFLQRDGQVHDMLLYGLLRREWEAQKRQNSSEGGMRAYDDVQGRE
jgi:RimJ/RimL family protein N-acetyltransferase